MLPGLSLEEALEDGVEEGEVFGERESGLIGREGCGEG